MIRGAARLARCALIGALGLAACGEPEQKTTIAQPRIEGQTVVFAPGSPQIASLALAPVEPRREAVLRFPGRLVWDEDRTVRVFSPLGGRVTAIAVRAGDRVRAGDTLAVVASPELGAAQAEARKAAEDEALARRNLARIEELHAAGVSPAKDLLAARAEAARAAAEHERSLARLRLYGASARAVDQRFALAAPIGGVVVERNLNPGQELRPEGQPEKGLFVISDPSRLWFVLDVAEADVGAVRVGAQVALRATLLGEEALLGRIAAIADFVDPQTRTVKVRGTVENPERRAKAEMFVTAELRVPAAGGFLVPSRAVYLRGEQHYVFVEAGEGRYERRRVRLGPSTNGHQVVLAGLAPGDRVVVDGNLLLERLLAAKD